MGIAKMSDYAKILDRLCHFLALSKTVDLNAITDNLLISTLACDPDLRLSSSQELRDVVTVYFEIDLSESATQASLDRLLGLGRVLRSNDGIFHLPPNVAAEVSDRVRAAYELQTRVRDEWLQEINGIHPRISSEQQDRLWNTLRAYMARAFHRHGAQTIQLLDPRIPIPTEVDERLSALLAEAIKESDTALPAEITRSVIHEFFRNQTPDRVKYLAQLLDGTFSFFALTADEATSKYLRGTFHPLAVFLDTNFIFGILNLHNNPLVEVSRELISFIGHHCLPVTLYYHPATLDEIRGTIYAIGDSLRERTWASAISRAAVRNGQVSGLELRYHSLNAQTPTDPETFLAVYERPEPLLRDQGFAVSPGLPTGDSDVERRGRLVAEYKAFIESRRRPKPYVIDRAIMGHLQSPGVGHA